MKKKTEEEQLEEAMESANPEGWEEVEWKNATFVKN